MLQAAKYLIDDLTFTFSFFFIQSKLNWTLFHLSGIFGCKKKVEIFLKYLYVEKMRDKIPKSVMSQLSLLLVYNAMFGVLFTGSKFVMVKLTNIRYGKGTPT